MNIAMFTDAYFPRVNGVAVSVESYATELSKLGHSVCVVCPDYIDNHTGMLGKHTVFKTFRYEEGHSEPHNFKVLRIPADNIVWSKEDRNARINQWKTIKTQLDIFSPHIVHVNTEFLMGWYGVTYARHRHKALVFTFHTLWEDYFAHYVHIVPAKLMKKMGQDIVKFYLKRADKIIVPTANIGKVVQRYGIEKEVHILPTGIPDSFLYCKKENIDCFRAAFFEKNPALQNKRILLYVGRIVKEKNLDFLFSVLESVLSVIPNVALLFVGGGPELKAMQEAAHTSPLKENIFFTEYRPRNELIYYYHLSDIFVFPSLTETQGLVTIEAMAAGLPVVAIGAKGTVDVMQGNNGGFMVENDMLIFAKRVIELLSDEALYETKRREAVQWGKKWALSSLALRLVNIYAECL